MSFLNTKTNDSISFESPLVEISDSSDFFKASHILVDKDTRVMYYLYDCGDKAAITPLYNADGSLRVYDGYLETASKY